MVIRAGGYSIWEKLQAVLDKKFKSNDVENYYFPLLIPLHLLNKEKDHLEGFSPELVIATHAGGEKLSEPYVLRPTSETIMYKTFSKWIQSHRDLPLKVNQWCNVIRWEKRTYPFLRSTEFLWQEGHTVHRTAQQAIIMAETALKWYKEFYRDYFAISSYSGIKSNQEKFAGATTTYSIELVAPNGKALQAATSHDLSDNFSKVFDISYLDEEGQKCYPYQTSWGISTRAIGGLILAHGDDSGIVLPPKIADPQIVVIAISSKIKKQQAKIVKEAIIIKQELAKSGFRVKLDTDFNLSLGKRINEWEIKGVPLRMEIGAKEIKNKKIKFITRENFSNGWIAFSEIKLKTGKILAEIQANLLSASIKSKKEQTIDIKTRDEFEEVAKTKKVFIRALWCETNNCEDKIKNKTKLTVRVLENDKNVNVSNGKCVFCNKRANRKWLFAKSY